VIARLEQVSAELGAGWAELIDVRSCGEEVAAVLELRADRRRRTHVGRFRLSFELDDDQIVRIRVAMDEATR